MNSNKNNVLIIDDDIGMMEAMSVVLDKYDIHLSVFTEPISALQELKNNKHDVLVINYLMPAIRGDEIIRKIREFDNDIYIILMSSHKDLAPSIEIMRSLDIQAFFEKSSRFDDLVLLIQAGYKYADQIRSIRNMSSTIANFGIEFANVLKNTVDAKDYYTKQHSDRVAAYSGLFATELKLEENDIKLLSLAANFHDIGKIGVEDGILMKNGPLTNDEYDKIKLHPVIGETILSSSEFFKDTLPLIRHHHERYDGKGYPDKLKGEKIPYLARLLSVCDTFDALTSKRVYRDEFSIDDALKEMNRVKGTQLDEKLCETFIDIVKNKPKEIQSIKTNTK